MGRDQHGDVSQLCDLGSKALRDPENTLGWGHLYTGEGAEKPDKPKQGIHTQCGEAGTTGVW